MITLDKLTKVFGTKDKPVIAADQISFTVPQGEICVLLGPSGCGKTTTLKMVNRLIEKTSGKILINGLDTDELDAVTLRRNIGYVIQQIGLFPNMTVEENICVVPRLLGWETARARRRAAELLDMVALDPAVFLKRFPKELSGGQQQRIGVARALAVDPPVMVMDEPFGAIDPINREVIQDEFLRMQESLRKTIMFVSHDIDEAVKMADKIAIFRAGKLEQYDSPDNVLAFPANEFIADFVGADRTLKRLRLVRVRDALQAAPTLQPGAAKERAIGLMRDHGLDGLAVLDAHGVLTGYYDHQDAERGASLPLRKMPAVVRPGDDLRTAVSLMFAHDITWLACLADDGRYQGVVTQRGIVRLLGETYRRRNSAAA